MKSTLKFAIPLFALALLAYLGYGTISQLNRKKTIAERVEQLPAFRFLGLDGRAFGTAQVAHRPVWLLYFNSTCEFCKMEIEGIQKNAAQLKSIQIIMASSEDSTTLRQFSINTNLNQYPHVHIVRDTNHCCYETFGMASTPASLLYSADGHLIARHNGVVKIEKIIQQFKNH